MGQRVDRGLGFCVTIIVARNAALSFSQATAHSNWATGRLYRGGILQSPFTEIFSIKAQSMHSQNNAGTVSI